MRKAQILNQVFVYILSAIVFTMVLIYGYKAIMDVKKQAEYVSLVELKTDLESIFAEMAITHNVQSKRFNIPSGYRKLCFIDNTLAYDSIECIGKIDYVVCDAWTYNTTQNIFLVPMAAVPMKTVRIELRNNSVRKGAICYDVSHGHIKLKLTGKGDRTLIEELRE